MAVPYFYFEAGLSESESAILNEASSRHIVQVLRMKPGDPLRLTNGKGGVFEAAIVRADKKQCIVQWVSGTQTAPSRRTIAVGISLVKNVARFEWFLEKATEIGVTEIFPLLCERTERNQFRHERMQSIMVSALEQSQQAWLPALSQPLRLPEALAGFRHQQRFIASLAGEATLHDLVNSNLRSQVVLIGPEGDFTAEETALALSHHFIPVSLGPHRLRTETAGIVAATLLAMD